MAEEAYVFSQLDKNSHAGIDPVSDGDNQIRLIKSVLKNQFPGGYGGVGLTEQVIASAAEMNQLIGATMNIQDTLNQLILSALGHENRLNALEIDVANLQFDLTTLYDDYWSWRFVAGTNMLFCNNFVPNGFGLNPNVDACLIRITTALEAGATGGGTSDILYGIPLSHSHTTGNHTLTTGEMPNHYHTYGFSENVGAAGPLEGGGGWDVTSTSQATGSTGSGGPHNHGNTGTSLATWTPYFVNTLLCTKL
jgi:hypothetical protein